MEKRQKAAAYGRVSTNSTEQAHSFENQSNYWNRKLAYDPKYEYVGLFADKGISGRHLRYRPQMLALLDACRHGEVDIIFTKSVQRFARNTVELLETVRELRELNVAVYFEKENINTLTAESELYLTIAAAVAEEDLNRYGQNVAWTIKDNFEKGDISVVGIRMLGYAMKNKQFQIVPHEAVIVRQLFEIYATGKYSTRDIAELLNGYGYRTLHGSLWTSQQVLATLNNEKYKGDALLYKRTNVNGQQTINRGIRDMIYVENSHDAIISPELWDKVQEVLNKKGNMKLRGKTLQVYPFTSLIKCPICGATYIHKINSSGTPYACPIWRCTTQLKYGKSKCANTGIKDSVLHEKFIEAYNEFIENKRYGTEENQLERELKKLNDDENELMALAVKGLIGKKDLDTDRAEIAKARRSIESKIREYRQAHLKKEDLKPITECDEELVGRMLRQITIQDWVVMFEFYNGVKISRQYTNGPSGNQKGWKEKKMLKEAQALNGNSN